MSAELPVDLALSSAVTSLLKGVVYRDMHEQVWDQLLRRRTLVADYVATIGLVVVLDEAEGYAFLRSLPDPEDGERAIPRLVARRSLSFHVSLLLALLRKRLAEFDASSSDPRLVLTREQIVDLVQVFLPSDAGEARVVDLIDQYIAKVVDLGFLRPVGAAGGVYEVRRILKSFVDTQWLADLDARLAEYAELLGDGGKEAR